MITEHHRAARRFVRCRDKHAYRVHMCGLCHALGDDYGLPLRLLTTHDAILLNLLTSAQREAAPEIVTRRCPLNPLATVKTNRDAGSAFAAAASVGLISASIADDLQDERSSLRVRAAAAVMKGASDTAQAHLAEVGCRALDNLTAAQNRIERTGGNPAQPTAEACASLFEMTATLSDVLNNTSGLALAGSGYGSYIYYADAYRDLDQDQRNGAFNPLLRFLDRVNKLTETGEIWLRTRFEDALHQIRDGLSQVRLQRDHATVERLLTAPIIDLIVQLGGTAPADCGCGGACGVKLATATEEDEKEKRGNASDLGPMGVGATSIVVIPEPIAAPMPVATAAVIAVSVTTVAIAMGAAVAVTDTITMTLFAFGDGDSVQ